MQGRWGVRSTERGGRDFVTSFEQYVVPLQSKEEDTYSIRNEKCAKYPNPVGHSQQRTRTPIESLDTSSQVQDVNFHEQKNKNAAKSGVK